MGQSETSGLGDRLGLIGIALVESKLRDLPRLRAVALRELDRVAPPKPPVGAGKQHTLWGQA